MPGPFEFVFGRHESDGAVQSDLVVVRHELAHDTSSVVERQRRLPSTASGLEGLVPPLDLAVRLMDFAFTETPFMNRR
jgi:hypothetical protein